LSTILESIDRHELDFGDVEVDDDAFGGDDGARTHDLRLAKPALSQLSYIPVGIRE
jgi:hypothetical protein